MARLFARFQQTSKYILKMIFLFHFFIIHNNWTADCLASVLLLLICQDTRGRQAEPVCVFFLFVCGHFCTIFGGLQTLERYYAEKRRCIFALLHETSTVKSNKSQSEKALTVWRFFPPPRNPRPPLHLVTALTCTTMFSQLMFLFKLIKSLAFNHRKKRI